MDYRDYIEITPGKRGGKPCLKQTRITVYDVLGWLTQGMKLLLDENLSYRLLKDLEPVFPGSAHVGKLGMGTALDADVWQFAKTEG